MDLGDFIRVNLRNHLNEQLILKNGYPIFYHGTTNKKLTGNYGLHVGSKAAANQALEAKIGVPSSGSWDGTRVYRDTLLAGKKRLDELLYVSGYDPIINFNAMDDVPDDDYYPEERTKRAVYFSSNKLIPLESKPIVLQVLITGEMINTYDNPYTDKKANSLVPFKIKDKGCYYTNIWEDAGSVSAVVPDNSFIKIIS